MPKKILNYFLEWPVDLFQLIVRPVSTLTTYPETGDWLKPIVLGLSFVLLDSFVLIASFYRISFGNVLLGLRTFGTMLLVGTLIFSLVFHGVVAFFGKNPGMYRTARFLTTLWGLSPFCIYFQSSHQIANIPIILLSLGLIYLFIRLVADWTVGRAFLFVGGTVFISALMVFLVPLLLLMIGEYLQQSGTTSVQREMKEFRNADQAPTTIEGSDTNKDGVRDDIEQFINAKFSNSSKRRAALRQLAMALQRAIKNPEYAMSNHYGVSSALHCVWYVDGENAHNLNKMIESTVVNTYERSIAYIHFNAKLSGHVFTSNEITAKECNLDVDQMKD